MLCFNYTSPLRITFLDRDDNNILNPNFATNIEAETLQSSTVQDINFELKNSIGGYSVGVWFLESIERPNRFGCSDWLDCVLCVNEECELYLSYVNSNKIDTLHVLYEKEITIDENNCKCGSYPLRYIKFNGDTITEFDNGTGAAIIRK